MYTTELCKKEKKRGEKGCPASPATSQKKRQTHAQTISISPPEIQQVKLSCRSPIAIIRRPTPAPT